jgi:hypothetical protein
MGSMPCLLLGGPPVLLLQLTVKENLQFYADMRLPGSWSRERRHKLVDQVPVAAPFAVWRPLLLLSLCSSPRLFGRCEGGDLCSAA